MQGGHHENKGISPSGDVIEVPSHRHKVKLNVVRFDIGLKYQLTERWRLESTLPYEVRSQDASIEPVASIDTPEQRNAMIRNQDIHHRNETYRSISDMKLLVAYKTQNFLRKGDQLTTKLGTTIPLGKTEEDPWKLGNDGLEHLHIQFGSGTFNPMAGLHYSLPIYSGLVGNMSVGGKYPFYENSKTYRGSWDVTYTAGLNYRVNNWLSLRTSYLGLYQSYAYWAGEKDINTGIRFSLASVGVSLATPYNVPLSITLMLPLQQETLYDDSNAFQESDAFELGMLVSLTALYAF